MVIGERPNRHAGLRHVALFVNKFEECLSFYTDLLGMNVEWQPDPDNIYLCSGVDNLALHRATEAPSLAGQRLDHIGFIIDEIDDVDRWYDFLVANGIKAQSKPRTHRDGARSFYCLDPDGVTVQMIYHPPISKGAS
jgi:catechol 2,3-dioxygenase-like lactoylglutathione lyase family enzyme